MATFIILGSYTAQGITNIKDAPSRLDATRAALAADGVTIKDFYLTLGKHDIVAVVDAPDTATAAKALMALGRAGNVSTTTLTALTEDEFRQVVASLD